MKSVNFYFKGLMCPVFTAFTTDKKTVVYDHIDKYCHLLKTKGVHGVLVNGTTGEGTCLRLDERKRLAEEWLKCCRKYGIICMVQIGGCCIAEVCELAEHCEKIGVDACLCLPDLFFKPRCEEDLCEYFKEICKYCPTRPMYYYHIPGFTGVKVCMARFYDLMEKCCPTFCGMKYTCGDMVTAVKCMKKDRNIILGADTIFCGALTLGFDAAILTTLNICPEIIVECYDHHCHGRLREAQECQRKLTCRVDEITCREACDWVESMKLEFNKVNSSICCGPHRKPTILKRTR